MDANSHNLIVIIFAAFIAILGAIGTYQSAKKAKAQDEAEQKQSEEAKARAIAEKKKREEDEYLKKVDTVYSGCRRRKITEWDSNESEIVLIARNILNDSSLSERDIQSYFELGKERFEAAEREKKDAARRQECDEVQAEKTRAELIGKEKYYTNTLEQMKICKKLVDDWHERIELRGQFIASAGMKPKPKSTVASATINSALFGTAAGVAAAEKTRAQNERAQAAYNSLQNTLQDTFSKPTDADLEAVRAEGKLEYLTEFKEYIDSAVCSEDSPEDYSRYLSVAVLQTTLSKSHRNLVVKAEVQVGTPEFLGTYAILDGSLRITATQDGKLIGEGYYCAPGFGEDVYSGRELGFSSLHSKTYSSIKRTTEYSSYLESFLIQVDDEIELSTASDIEIEVEPYHLWLLEGDTPVLEDEIE